MNVRAEEPKARVLVAEDDPALRRLLELRLGMGPYDVRAVEDGADALDLLQDWVPDILVCDVMMPRVSGLTVCREVRADDRHASLPIILLTARVFDEDIERIMGLGGITFMNKPFDFRELNETIDSRLAETGDSPPHVQGTDRLGWLNRSDAPIRGADTPSPAPPGERPDRRP